MGQDTSIRTAINGGGTIGRCTIRDGFDDPENPLLFVAVNDPFQDNKTLAHLLKYDSVYGPWRGHTVSYDEDGITIDGTHIRVLHEMDPEKLPWAEMRIDLVIEASGKFCSRAGLQKHLTAGAKKVILTAPPENQDCDEPVKTIVYGINHGDIGPRDLIISNGSCTTNCLMPLTTGLKPLGLIELVMLTVHGQTGDQRLVDAPHKDLRRARASTSGIIPTKTGATKAAALVDPFLAGKMVGGCLRVLSPTSIVVVAAFFDKPVVTDQIIAAFLALSEGELKGILAMETDPVVSVDIVGRTEASIVDVALTQTTPSGRTAMVYAWYDNVRGYVRQLRKTAKALMAT